MKPYLRQALESVVAQTRRDLQVLVVDSGRWIGSEDELSLQMAAICSDYQAHPLVEWVFTGEGADLRQHKCPIGYVTNEVIRAGLVRGRYVCTFYDDDRYRPTFMERMAGHLDEHPDAKAVHCSEARVVLHPAGPRTIGMLVADGPRRAGQMDCQVDGAQVMFRREVLDEIGDPWLVEGPDWRDCSHSDGLFLERLASVCGEVSHVSEVLVEHRHTDLSTYTPASAIGG